MEILNNNMSSAKSWFTPQMEVSSHHAASLAMPLGLIGDCESNLAWGMNHILTHKAVTSQQQQYHFCDCTLRN